MRAHQQNLVRSLYDLASEGEPLHADFERWWSEVVSTRGELDRKKKVSAGEISAALGSSEGEASLERFVYSVERYLLVRGMMVIEASAAVSLEGGSTLPPVIAEALPAYGSVVEQLSDRAGDALRSERAEVNALAEDRNGSIEDMFQGEFMGLIPAQVRHAIGSFYTPQWLARHVIRSVGYKWEAAEGLSRVVCDPCCGSGVFLVAAAEEVRQAVVAGVLSVESAVSLITTRLRGIDIELVPSVLAAANLTLAVRRVAAAGDMHGSLPIPTGISHGDSLDEADYRADVVVGNPPWVNWEYLPAEYREKHRDLWPMLNAFDSASKRLSFSKEDISALFVAHAVSERLSLKGQFAIVLPESLVKSAMNHRGFRRFEVGLFPQPYKVSVAEDFVAVRPFEGVANRTIVLYGARQGETTYPLPYLKWSKVDRRAQPITGSASLSGIKDDGWAQLSDGRDVSSSWSTGSSEGIATHRMLDGTNPYRARTGLFTGGANAVFHLRLLGNATNGSVRVENVVERAKRAAPLVQAELETAHIYPFLRGRDVSQWSYGAELGVLLPHTADTRMEPIAPERLAINTPQTLEYLTGFRSVLDERRGFSKWEAKYRETGFYTLQRVGDYTFADWKVVWRYISASFTTAVVGPIALSGMEPKPAIPNEKLMLISCVDSTEAYYLGAVLASSLVIQHVHSRMVSTQISPSIVAGIGVPLFDPSDQVHSELSSLCEQGHEAVAAGRRPEPGLIARIDELAAGLWDVPPEAAATARLLLAS
ncbi:N-6 DNA methylase [Leifsonia aquatica]